MIARINSFDNVNVGDVVIGFHYFNSNQTKSWNQVRVANENEIDMSKNGKLTGGPSYSDASCVTHYCTGLYVITAIHGERAHCKKY
jgi:hypothetical protein